MAKKRTVSRGARQLGKLTRLYESRSDQMKYCDWRRGRRCHAGKIKQQRARRKRKCSEKQPTADKRLYALINPPTPSPLTL